MPFGSIGLTRVRDRPVAREPRPARDRAGRASARSSRSPAHWRVVADLVLIGLFGGFYIVPLYALIQERSRARAPLAHHRRQQHPERAVHGGVGGPRHRAARRRAVDPASSSSSPALLNAAVALYIYRLVPEFLMRFLAWLLIHTMYRVRQGGPRATCRTRAPCIVVCNHVSYVDAIVIAACVRRPIRFVMDHRIFRIPLLVVPLPHDAHDPDRVGEGGRGAEGAARSRRRRRRCAPARSSASFPEGTLTDDRRAEPVPARRRSR